MPTHFFFLSIKLNKYSSVLYDIHMIYIIEAWFISFRNTLSPLWSPIIYIIGYHRDLVHSFQKNTQSSILLTWYISYTDRVLQRTHSFLQRILLSLLSYPHGIISYMTNSFLKKKLFLNSLWYPYDIYHIWTGYYKWIIYFFKKKAQPFMIPNWYISYTDRVL